MIFCVIKFIVMCGDKMNQEKIGKFLIYLRREKKLTQAQLAEKLNVSDKTISKWERGICLPEMNTIELIIKFFDITLMEFYTGERNELLSNKLINDTTKSLVENVNKNQHKKFKKVIFIILLVSFFILFGITSLFMINTYGKYSEYRIISSSDKYNAEGCIMVAKEKSYITLLNINITDSDLLNIRAHNFEYELTLDNVLILKNGDIYSDTYNDYILLSDYLKTISIYIDHDLSEMIYKKEINKQILSLKIKYLDNQNNEQILEMIFNLEKSFSNNTLFQKKSNF